MSNHHHILIETPTPSLSKGMKYINGTYTQWFNRRHCRVGHLFQGRFKSILVERDAYLLELSRYIVLNPVRAGIIRSAKDWRWSSYRATAGLGKGIDFLCTDKILGLFGREKASSQKAYRKFVSQGKRQTSLWEGLKNQIYLGSDQFVNKTQREITAKQSLDDIPKAQKKAPVKQLSFYEKRHETRNRAMAEAYRSGHFTLKQVGEYFGVSYATVSRAVKQAGV